MRIARPLRLSLTLLMITLLLWIPPILFFARAIPPVVNRIFLKAPGLYLVYLGMVFCPLAAVWLGRRLVRSGERPLWGRRTTYPAVEALERVLSRAGATRPQRDPVDTRVILDVRNRTGRIIDSPKEVGGYPRLAGGEPPADTDHDGMPDDWERQKGLDPGDPSDGSKDRDGDGYTNIEEYLHSLI